jgi:hypothetical protein
LNRTYLAAATANYAMLWHVTLYCHWDDDAKTLCASFVLPEPVAEENFNSSYDRNLLQS